MKSDVCILKNDIDSLSAVLSEVEIAAAYRGLSEKKSRQLRLLAEELVEMLPELLAYCEADFWVESEGLNYELHVSTRPIKWEFETRQRVLSVSSDGKNAAAVGIIGKIRVVADMLVGGYTDVPTPYYNFYNLGMNEDPCYGNTWSLVKYIDEIEQRKDKEGSDKYEPWDELEKSIIANLADDVKVSIVGGVVSITVFKNFADK